jgi:hypothetical protein
MSSTQTLLALCSAVFLALFMAGTTPSIYNHFIEMGLAVRDLPYVLALPGMAAFTLYMLKI